MNDNQLDDLFRAGHRDREGYPEQASWEALSERLDAFDRRRIRKRRYWRAAAAVLLLGGLAAGFALFNQAPVNTAIQAGASEKTISMPQPPRMPAANEAGDDRVPAPETKPAPVDGMVPATAVAPENISPAGETSVEPVAATPQAANAGIPERGTALEYGRETADATYGETPDKALEQENIRANNMAMYDAEEDRAATAGFGPQQANAKQRAAEQGNGSARSGYRDPHEAPALEVRWSYDAPGPCPGTVLIVNGTDYRVYPCGDLAASAAPQPVAGTVLDQMLSEGLRSRLETFTAKPDCPDSPYVQVSYGVRPDDPVRLPLSTDCLPGDLRQLTDALVRLVNPTGH